MEKPAGPALLATRSSGQILLDMQTHVCYSRGMPVEIGPGLSNRHRVPFGPGGSRGIAGRRNIKIAKRIPAKPRHAWILPLQAWQHNAQGARYVAIPARSLARPALQVPYIGQNAMSGGGSREY